MPRGSASSTTPGKVLTDKYISKYNLSVKEIADAIGEKITTIKNIVEGDGSKFSPALAARLAKYFGDKPEYWIELQSKSQLAKLKEDDSFQNSLKLIKKFQTPDAKGGGRRGAGKAKADAAAKKPARKAKPASAAKKPRARKGGGITIDVGETF